MARFKFLQKTIHRTEYEFRDNPGHARGVSLRVTETYSLNLIWVVPA